MTKTVEDALLAAQVWVDHDPDPETRNKLLQVIEQADGGDSNAQAALTAAFSGRLTFGTAGIRGPLGFGPGAMNRVVVSQTTAALARFLLSRATTATTAPRVVVGYDARKNSSMFASDTAEVLSGHGIEVLLTPTYVPTPIVAFAVRHLGCDAGIMVTASHNPASDNGYKIYLGGVDEGSQIVPPTNQEIEHEINLVATTLLYDQIPRSTERTSQTPTTLEADYTAATLASLAPFTAGKSGVTSVYSAMHGVGGETFIRVVGAAGFAAPVLVEEQFQPDPLFPSVAIPNPEENEALDRAFARARDVGADIVIAHDPDADRLAVALPDSSPAGYRTLTGNQVGAILGWWCAKRATAAGVGGTLANSIVSSPVLRKIAAYFGLNHVETLTGFKYVSRVPDLIFGFEEALGYLVNPEVVRDKDGISAALAILDIAQGLAAERLSLWDYLTGIEQAVGGFASGQITITTDVASSSALVTDLMRKRAPQKIGTREVDSCDDFLEGVDNFPAANILRYCLRDGSRVIVRPSGTEPKVKVYLDTTGATKDDAEAALASLARDVRNIMGPRGYRQASSEADGPA